MKPPRSCPSWAMWRQYHATVWKQVAKTRWATMAIAVLLVISALLNVVGGGPRWLLFELVVLNLFNGMFLGCALGRHYASLDAYIRTQAQWLEMQQKIRAQLIEDGMAPDEADQTVWQMDLDMEKQMKRGWRV